MLKTARLLLLPATLEMLRADNGDKDKLQNLLNAKIPESWPPETMRDAFPWFIEQLERFPAHGEWYAWYVLLTDKDLSERTLVGSAGFKGAPNDKGEVEIGYSVLPEFQGKGFATEMTEVLVDFAFSEANVESIVAETSVENLKSIKVLKKNGFVPYAAREDAVFYCVLRKN